MKTIKMSKLGQISQKQTDSDDLLFNSGGAAFLMIHCEA